LDSLPEKSHSELSRRHKAAVTLVGSLIIATILLTVVAYLGRDYLTEKSNPPLEMAVQIAVLFLGIASIVWRRTKFSAMRLRDIGGLNGATGLLATLEKTTIQLALIGAAIAVIGFVSTVVTGNPGFTYQGTAISLVVFLYSFPTKSSWSRVVRAFAEQSPAE
jgi:hypothetical protein